MQVSRLEKFAVVVCCLVLGAGVWFWIRQVLAAIELLQMVEG